MPTKRTHCGWCGLPIELLVDGVPRCKVCNTPVCHPNQRTCGYDHWQAKHSARPVVEVQGP